VVLLDDPNRDKEKPAQPIPPPQPTQPKFISLYTNAIQDEFKKYQDHTLPIIERVRAGHRFLTTAAHVLATFGEKVLAKRILAFVSSYVPPRTRYSVQVSASGIPIRRVTVGGATEFFSDFSITDDPRVTRLIEDQRHEEYYNRELAPRVAYVLVKLAQYGVVRKTPRTLAPSVGGMFTSESSPEDIEWEGVPDESSEADDAPQEQDEGGDAS